MPATAPFASSKMCRSMSIAARPWCCSAPTATESRRSSNASWACAGPSEGSIIGRDRRREAQSRRQERRGDRRPRHRAGAGRPPSVSAPDGRGKSPARRVPQEGARAAEGRISHFCYEAFPRLAERKSQLAGSMSGGEHQMLALARALMEAPKILLIDEPSVGLAPVLVIAHHRHHPRAEDRSISSPC